MKSCTRLKDLWKFKFFLDDTENAKNDANILKSIFFWICDVFLYFWIFLKNYQNMGQKLGSNNSYDAVDGMLIHLFDGEA